MWAVAVSVLASLTLTGEASNSRGQSRRAPSVVHSDKSCGFSITVPANWRVESRQDPNNPGACFVTVRPSNWEHATVVSDVALPPYPISFALADTSLETAAQKAKLQREHEGWVLRSGTVDDGQTANPLEGDGWNGLRWRAFAGNRHYRTGGNAGAGFSTMVVLGSARRSASLCLTEDEFDGAFRDMVASLHFLPRRAKSR